jgi:DMSO reductase family type II enzyme heme b subunit
MKTLKLFAFVALGAALLTAAPVVAETGNADKGKAIYDKRCAWCHGENGDGNGPGAEKLNPPPRDFTSGNYKIKTSNYGELVPNDDDIVRMIRDGMPGTAMPGWRDLLSDEDIRDLVAYVKSFAGFDRPPEAQVDFGKQIPSSPESIAEGKKLFEQGDRCVECHGPNGKGNASKRIMGDLGERTWPRNLTKPWTFRGGSQPRDIFTRITTGIAGTVMPSFANPRSRKSLTIEERWHIANYVASLAKKEEVVDADNTVIKAERLDDKLPETTDDPRWSTAAPTTFFLVPQIIAEERLFKPSNDTITVRAIYNGEGIAILLEWDDRTKSIPGDFNVERIGDEPTMQDGVAIQLPVLLKEGMEKPYFGMGDTTHPVNVWHWSSGSKDTSESVEILNSKGYADIEKRAADTAGLQATSNYDNGTWKVLMRRPLTTQLAEKDIQFAEGRYIPIAFAAWDGSNNSESGSKHTMTTWYWLFLKPAGGATPVIVALLVFAVFLGGLFWWGRSATARTYGEKATR